MESEKFEQFRVDVAAHLNARNPWFVRTQVAARLSARTRRGFGKKCQAAENFCYLEFVSEAASKPRVKTRSYELARGLDSAL